MLRSPALVHISRPRAGVSPIPKLKRKRASRPGGRETRADHRINSRSHGYLAGFTGLDECHPCPGAMSYPPSHNGQYSPQYLQQHHNLQPPQQTIQPQLLYNNVNAVNANANASAYQYGKPAAYPQVTVPPYQAYGQVYNLQQHQPQLHHQPQPPPPPPPQQQPPPPQFVNPSDIFQQPLLPSPSPSSFSNHRSPQYGAQSPAVPVAGNNRPPALTTSTPVAPAPVPTPIPAPTPTYSPVPIANQVNNQHSNKSAQPAATPKPPVQAKPVTVNPPAVAATPPAPSPKPVQVLIPAPSPEVQQHIQRPPPKKQTQKQPTQQPAQKPAKPGIDYQVLLLAMADEYLNAAHSHGTTVALLRREMELEEYYRLVATGLGCLEAVLKV